MTCSLQGATSPISINPSKAAPALAPGTTVFHHGTMAISERIEATMGSAGHPPQWKRRLRPEPTRAMAAASYTRPKSCPIGLRSVAPVENSQGLSEKPTSRAVNAAMRLIDELARA